MADEEFTPPSLARANSSRSFKLKKGLKRGSQTSAPVDVVFDTFEVSISSDGGECACVCEGRFNACFLSSVGASFSNIRA